jgi:hypothetical protein
MPPIIYKRITFEYNNLIEPQSPLSNNLIAWYKFESNINDYNPTSRKNHLVVNSGSQPEFSTDFFQGRKYLKGANSILATQTNIDNTNLLTINYSISVWIRGGTHIAPMYIIGVYHNSPTASENERYLEIKKTWSSNSLNSKKYFYLSGSVGREATSDSFDDENVWVHMVFVQYEYTREDNEYFIIKKIYRNGVLVATPFPDRLYTQHDARTSRGILRIYSGVTQIYDDNGNPTTNNYNPRGSYGPSATTITNTNARSSKVDLSDLRIYNVSLTDENVSTLYKSYTSNNYSINFNGINTAIINDTPISVSGSYDINIEQTRQIVTSNEFRLITTPLVSNVLTIKYPTQTTTSFPYKKDGFLKYVAGSQASELTRDTGRWEIVDYDTIDSVGIASSINATITSTSNILVNMIKKTVVFYATVNSEYTNNFQVEHPTIISSFYTNIITKSPNYIWDSAGKFTAPFSGYYNIKCSAVLSSYYLPPGSTNLLKQAFYINIYNASTQTNRIIGKKRTKYTYGQTGDFQTSECIIDLMINDVVSILVDITQSTTGVYLNDTCSISIYFIGEL